MAAAGTVTVNVVPLTRTAGRDRDAELPLRLTTERLSKFAPVMVSVKLGLPAMMLSGASDEIVGSSGPPLSGPMPTPPPQLESKTTVAQVQQALRRCPVIVAPQGMKRWRTLEKRRVVQQIQPNEIAIGTATWGLACYGRLCGRLSARPPPCCARMSHDRRQHRVRPTVQAVGP